jgi:hypothetical protein
MLPEELDGTVTRNADGSYTYNGVTYTESAFEEFISGMGLTLQDLDVTRNMLTRGELTSIRGANFDYMDQSSFERVDAINLKLGDFDDAEELREAYREIFYKERALQVDRIYHSYDTGKVVSEDILENYTDTDGNIAADVSLVGNEFDAGDGPTETDVEDIREDNEEGAATETDEVESQA